MINQLLKKHFVTASFLVLTLFCFVIVIKISTHQRSNASPSKNLVPWKCIGGCGVGSTGKGSSGISWVGTGMQGGLLHVEALEFVNAGQTFRYAATVPRLTINATNNTQFGVSLPVNFKEAEIQFSTNMNPQVFLNSGLGDITVDGQYTFGTIGQYTARLSCTFPTADASEKRGPDQSKYLLPQSMQNGQGIYTAALRCATNVDLDKQSLLLEGIFSYPFMARLDRKNEFLETDYKDYTNVTVNRERFYYPSRLKLYGESDRGDFYPPSVNLNVLYAYHTTSFTTQSLQLFFSAPLGVRWIHSYVQTQYDPRPDPENRAWDAVVAYGCEFSQNKYPLFIGIGLPLHDKSSRPSNNMYDPMPYTKWNGVDWNTIGKEWIFAAGIKSAW